MTGKIEIDAGDVNDVEAHVFARYIPDDEPQDDRDSGEPVVVRGTLRGPYCERAQTLPAEYAFRDLRPERVGLAEAIVPDPCTWSRDLPHLYRVDIEARLGTTVIAEYHSHIGLCRAASKNV